MASHQNSYFSIRPSVIRNVETCCYSGRTSYQSIQCWNRLLNICNHRRQEPITRSLQLPLQANATAFLQTSLFSDIFPAKWASSSLHEHASVRIKQCGLT